MASVERPAGVAGTFEYVMSIVPAEAPKLTIYSNVDRTVVAHPEQTGVATANPSIFRFSYPGTLAAGTYYLGVTAVHSVGQAATADNNDMLVLVTVAGDVVGSLVTRDRYRKITRDTTSADSDVDQALVDAQGLVEGYLRRPLALAERTETLRIAANGRVFPSATPILVAPTGYTIDGYSLSGASPDQEDIFDPNPSATITYTGGYTSQSLPKRIEFRIAKLAKSLLEEPSEYPEGATSVRLGDASIDFRDESGAMFGIAARNDLRPYRRRRVA